MITVPMTVSTQNVTIPMTVSASSVDIEVTVGASYSMVSTPEYEGAYEFTPSSETQTISISGHKATEDIIINPIPENYGLITWNGSVLTVS